MCVLEAGGIEWGGVEEGCGVDRCILEGDGGEGCMMNGNGVEWCMTKIDGVEGVGVV